MAKLYAKNPVDNGTSGDDDEDNAHRDPGVFRNMSPDDAYYEVESANHVGEIFEEQANYDDTQQAQAHKINSFVRFTLIIA